MPSTLSEPVPELPGFYAQVAMRVHHPGDERLDL
jgi:hypothetical protein